MLAPSLGALVALMLPVLQRTQLLAEQILLGEIPLEGPALYQAVQQAARLDPGPALWVLGLCWLLGILDAYWLARRQPGAQKNPAPGPGQGS